MATTSEPFIGAVTGNDYALEWIETTFNQDLNGDGTIGPIQTTIQTDTNSFGSTSLTVGGNEYSISTASADPVLQVWRRRRCGGRVWRLGADRRGADGKRL